MKTFYFNIQSKGGSGKSMLTYLQGLSKQKNEEVVFVDMDSSSRTSIKQLSFLKKEKRVIEINLNNHTKNIEREKFFSGIERLNELPYKEFYLDFGSPESTQFPTLFNFDFSIGEFKEFEKEIEAQFIFNIVISGGPAYVSCMEYADVVVTSICGQFPVFLYLNDFSFTNQQYLFNEIYNYIKEKKEEITGAKHFGNISMDRESGQKILQNVKRGKGLEEFVGFATKTIIKREIAKL